MKDKDYKGIIAAELIIVAREEKGKRPTELTFIELIDVTDSIVKKLLIHGVSQQRELLEAYTKQVKEDNELTEEITFQDINKCLASNFG